MVLWQRTRVGNANNAVLRQKLIALIPRAQSEDERNLITKAIDFVEYGLKTGTGVLVAPPIGAQ
jgi:hypothetical protein